MWEFLPSIQTEGDQKQKDESKARDEPRWKVADKNADSKLDKDEFNAFLHPENHEHMKALIVKETIHDVDTNKDGFISYEEYMSMFFSFLLLSSSFFSRIGQVE